MYCTKCGIKLADDDIFCPACGAKAAREQVGITATAQPIQPITPAAYTVPAYVPPPAPPVPAPAPKVQSNACAIIGFVFSLVGWMFTGLTIPGLVLGIVGLVQAKKGAPYKGLAIAAIILSCLGTFAIILLYVFVFITQLIQIGLISPYYNVTCALLLLL